MLIRLEDNVLVDFDTVEYVYGRPTDGDSSLFSLRFVTHSIQSPNDYPEIGADHTNHRNESGYIDSDPVENHRIENAIQNIFDAVEDGMITLDLRDILYLEDDEDDDEDEH